MSHTHSGNAPKTAQETTEHLSAFASATTVRVGSGAWLGGSGLLPGMVETAQEEVARMTREQREERAIELIRMHEPEDGYYLADSGGKDSGVVRWLAQQAGVRFDAHYNNTTIDPPELVRFLKKHHPETQWSHPEMPMMTMVATSYKTPPTRSGRWCCEVYKEGGGDGRTKLMGVRAEESKGRARNWHEIAKDMHGSPTICPIVFWTVAQVWETTHAHAIPYCSLYDEGWERLGCVGCPLATKENQDREFARWPTYERNWKKAIIANWTKWKDVPRKRDGMPRYHAKFKTGEDFWQWWRTARAPDYFREDCQSGLLWTNQTGEDAPLPPNVADEPRAGSALTPKQ